MACASLFERDRLLFEQHPEDSRPFPPSELASAAVKFDQCTYVGDKAPALFRRIDALAKAIPHAKFIVIVRNPEPVAMSWQRRADRENDPWPETRDYRVGEEVPRTPDGEIADALEVGLATVARVRRRCVEEASRWR